MRQNISSCQHHKYHRNLTGCGVYAREKTYISNKKETEPREGNNGGENSHEKTIIEFFDPNDCLSFQIVSSNLSGST